MIRQIRNIAQVSFGTTPSEGPDGLEVETDDGTFFVVGESSDELGYEPNLWTIFRATQSPAPYDSGGQVGLEWDCQASALQALIHRDGE